MTASLLLVAVASLGLASSSTAGDGPSGWIPLADDTLAVCPGSALDFSGFRPSAAAAGELGRVIATNGHFAFERDAAQPVRFFGVNVCSAASVMPEDRAEAFAQMLARRGYNAVRFHHQDASTTTAAADGTLDPAKMRRFDALVKACVDRGIYLTLDLQVTRRLSWRACGIDREGLIDKYGVKRLIVTDRRVRANYLAYAKNFLTHVNPLTGRDYAHEPALIGVSLINELNPDKISASEERAFVGEAKALFDSLGCRTLVTDLNLGRKFSGDMVSVRQDCLDYADTHRYVHHPKFATADKKGALRQNPSNPLLEDLSRLMPAAEQRLAGKPAVITEWNWPVPCAWRGASGLVTGSAAARDGWDGLWRFAWSHSNEGATSVKPLCCFDIASDPINRLSEYATAAFFLRRDGDGARLVTTSGVWCVDSPRTCAAAAGAGTFSAGALRGRLDSPAAVWITSLDARPLAESQRLVAFHLTDARMTGATFSGAQGENLDSWGKPPVLIRRGVARLSLALGEGNWKVFALGMDGARVGEVPCAASGKTLSFVADTAALPARATLAYEIVRNPEPELETPLLVRPGGVTEFSEAGIRLTPTVYYPGWTAREAKGGWRPEADGARRWRIPAREYNDTAHPLADGRTGWTAQSDGSVTLDYRFEPLRSDKVLCVAVVASLPNDAYAGGTLVADGRKVSVPAVSGKPFVYRSRVKAVAIHDRTGARQLSVDFPDETEVLLQDNRSWRGKAFSLRIYLVSGERELAPGQNLALACTVRAPKPIRCETKSFQITAGKDWFPVDGSFFIEPGSALDFTDIGGTGRPAGKYGYPVVRNGHFEFERLPGKPQRFYGVNFIGAANNPDIRYARPFAENLARLGYNAARMHHHDHGITGGGDGVLDAAVMARFDAFVAALVENGIYVTTDLYVSRKPLYRDCGIDRDGRFEKIDFYKRVAMFHEGTFRNFIRCARTFLEHVNPHTGRRYADEPALGWLSYLNEGTLGSSGFDWIGACREDVEAKWKAWLEGKRKDDAAYAAIPETIPTHPKDLKSDTAHRNAFLLFLADVERAFDRRVTRFIREEMKCRALVTNMNYGFKPPSFQKLIADELDYMDDHFYVDHPHFLERNWKLPSELENGNTFRRATAGAMYPVTRRIFGKPFVITEYNYSGPGRYRGVGGIATGAMAALQDWDGLWRFAWSHGDRGIRETKPMTYFDMSGDPLSLASERASMCLFLRRDVEPFAAAAAYRVDRKTADALSTMQLDVPTGWRPVAWRTKVGCFVGDDVPAGLKIVGSSRDGRAELAQTPEIPHAARSPIAVDSSAGSFTISTARTAGGFAERGRIVADGFAAVIDSPATVWASSLDGKSLADSSRVLVTHLTDVQNAGITYADSSRRILMEWGNLPHLMRKGRADLSLGLKPGDWKVYVLSPAGKRLGLLAADWRGDRLVFTSEIGRDPASAPYLYELTRTQR